jgi:hypothetical protein
LKRGLRVTPANGKTIRERLHEGGVLFDGGMGSMLIAGGLALGSAPEESAGRRTNSMRPASASPWMR